MFEKTRRNEGLQRKNDEILPIFKGFNCIFDEVAKKVEQRSILIQ